MDTTKEKVWISLVKMGKKECQTVDGFFTKLCDQDSNCTNAPLSLIRRVTRAVAKFLKVTLVCILGAL